MSLLKRFAARLPFQWQYELRRIHHCRQIRRGTFLTSEPEYNIIPQLITSGDWVIDIGANVGYYTKRFSELVGAHGRVISFEPVPTTFSLLAANVKLFAHANVTLINAAVSDCLAEVGMSIPQFSTGLENYYRANISSAANSSLLVLTISLDSLCINQPVALVKIDVEGHESFVLAGMQGLIEKHHPIIIIETGSTVVIDKITSLGYKSVRLYRSPNVLFMPNI